MSRIFYVRAFYSDLDYSHFQRYRVGWGHLADMDIQRSHWQPGVAGPIRGHAAVISQDHVRLHRALFWQPRISAVASHPVGPYDSGGELHHMRWRLVDLALKLVKGNHQPKTDENVCNFAYFFTCRLLTNTKQTTSVLPVPKTSVPDVAKL